MSRRSKAGGKPTKSLRRKAVTSGRRNAPKTVRRRGSSPSGRETKTALPTRELSQARERPRLDICIHAPGRRQVEAA